MGLVFKLLGFIWGALGFANLVIVIKNGENENIITLAIIFNMTVFVLPGAILYGIGYFILKSKTKKEIENPSDGNSIDERLNKLKILFDKDQITSEEYEKLIAKINLMTIDVMNGEENVVNKIEDEEKTCPMCAEKVKAAAKICRFCGHTFSEINVKKKPEKTTEIEIQNGYTKEELDKLYLEYCVNVLSKESNYDKFTEETKIEKFNNYISLNPKEPIDENKILEEKYLAYCVNVLSKEPNYKDMSEEDKRHHFNNQKEVRVAQASYGQQLFIALIIVVGLVLFIKKDQIFKTKETKDTKTVTVTAKHDSKMCSNCSVEKASFTNKNTGKRYCPLCYEINTPNTTKKNVSQYCVNCTIEVGNFLDSKTGLKYCSKCFDKRYISDSVKQENSDIELKVHDEISFDLNSKDFADANPIFVKKFKTTFTFAESIFQKNRPFFEKHIVELYNSNVAKYDNTFRGWNKIYNNVNDFKINDQKIKKYLDKQMWTDLECKEFIKLVDTYNFLKIN